jgi:hypothetical protein
MKIIAEKSIQRGISLEQIQCITLCEHLPFISVELYE